MTPDERHDALRQAVRRLTADIALLREDVDSLLEAGAQSVDAQQTALAASTNAWTAMTAEDAARAWTQLAGWVDWIVQRYELLEAIPACWYRHGALVEELHALHLAWRGAFASQSAHAGDPLIWHEHLDRALVRMRDWDRHGCAAGEHRELPAGLMPESAAGSADSRDHYIAADVAARREATQEA